MNRITRLTVAAMLCSLGFLSVGNPAYADEARQKDAEHVERPNPGEVKSLGKWLIDAARS